MNAWLLPWLALTGCAETSLDGRWAGTAVCQALSGDVTVLLDVNPDGPAYAYAANGVLAASELGLENVAFAFAFAQARPTGEQGLLIEAGSVTLATTATSSTPGWHQLDLTWDGADGVHGQLYSYGSESIATNCALGLAREFVGYDKCPTTAEDFDGIDDDDGCPEF